MSTALDRMSIDDWTMNVAIAVSLRADCRRGKTGVVILSPNNRILATGHNDTPPGEPGCLAGHCPRGLLGTDEVPPRMDYKTGPGFCIGVHAEDNAISDAHERNVNIIGATVYATSIPCGQCMELINDSGLARLVYRHEGRIHEARYPA